MDQKITRGYVHIYTGNGKGKTTAALGLALRAAGHGLRSYIGQFMKGQSYGELNAVKLLSPLITIEQFGKDTFIHVDRATPEDIEMAQIGLDKIMKNMKTGNYQIIVMDEVNVALHLKVLKVEEVLSIIEAKPSPVELILTGRYAPDILIERADLVTEMLEIKHYYQRGVAARDGVER